MLGAFVSLELSESLWHGTKLRGLKCSIEFELLKKMINYYNGFSQQKFYLL